MGRFSKQQCWNQIPQRAQPPEKTQKAPSQLQQLLEDGLPGQAEFPLLPSGSSHVACGQHTAVNEGTSYQSLAGNVLQLQPGHAAHAALPAPGQAQLHPSPSWALGMLCQVEFEQGVQQWSSSWGWSALKRFKGSVTERRDRASPALTPFLPVKSHIKWLSCGFSPPPPCVLRQVSANQPNYSPG